jgi:hypothetical protein
MSMINNGKVAGKLILPVGLMTPMLKRLLRIGRLIEMEPRMFSLNYLSPIKLFY